MSPRFIDRVADEIGLDDETVSKIKDIIFQGRRTAVDLKAKIEQAKLDFERTMDRPEPDRAAVMASIETLGLLKIKMHQHRAGVMLSIRSHLSPEQRTQLKTLQAKRKMKRGKRGKRGRKHHRRTGEEPSW